MTELPEPSHTQSLMDEISLASDTRGETCPAWLTLDNPPKRQEGLKRGYFAVIFPIYSVKLLHVEDFWDHLWEVGCYYRAVRVESRQKGHSFVFTRKRNENVIIDALFQSLCRMLITLFFLIPLFLWNENFSITIIFMFTISPIPKTLFNDKYNLSFQADLFLLDSRN